MRYLISTLLWLGIRITGLSDVPVELRPWLVEQNWQRDSGGPIISLGESGDFDDTHIFAPMVAEEDGRYQMWYSGSRGSVAERVFRLGLATGGSPVHLEKYDSNPVLEMRDGMRSVLTASLLRFPNGSVRREDGKLRTWFSAASLSSEANLHTLHETFSDDGIQ